MNSGRDDWIGINLDNIPMPKRNAAKKGKYLSWSNESSSLFALVDARKSQGRLATSDASSERAKRYPARASAMIPLTSAAGQSAALQPPHQFIQFDSSDSASRLPHSSGQKMRYASSIVSTKIPVNTVSWLPSHPQTHALRFHDIFSCKHGSDDSNFSSGTSVSCTSSSFSGNCESSTEIDADLRRSSEYLKVKFKSEDGTKFDNVIRRVESVLDKPFYRLDKIGNNANDKKEMPMFYCPNCKTNQRDFINFATAAGQYGSPQGYLALYFVLYLVASLFVFGLEEGWTPIDCVYFSVITLTTTGLGDFVPSSDGAKIVCTCFIYVGVATIGLLLGSLLVGSMDEAHRKEAREAQIRDCPNCARLEKARSRCSTSNKSCNTRFKLVDGYDACTPSDASIEYEDAENIGLDLFENIDELPPDKTGLSVPSQAQIHTRHMSIDIGGNLFGNDKPSLRRFFSGEFIALPVDESTFLPGTAAPRLSTDPSPGIGVNAVETKSQDSSYSSSSTSTHSSVDPIKPMTRVKAAKYVFLTLKQALMNSVFIIAAGSFGFYYIEEMSAVDSFYFTTVLLTSVGYGDIVPVTTAGKLFTTIFTVVAGTVLLRNMSLISMIPLELRKRRVEIAVLGQFGSQLTDDELRELSTGRLIHRLKLATNRPDGLEECTREMFSLAMLVRLGRITEHDVKSTFAAFRRLDVGNYGKLNSRTVIEGEVMRRRKSLKNLVAQSQPSEEWGKDITDRFENQTSYPEFITEPHHCSPKLILDTLPDPTFMVSSNEDYGSLIKNSSHDSYYSHEVNSHTSSFDVNDNKRWASTFTLYSPKE